MIFFFKAKDISYLMETIDIKRMADKLNMHIYLLLSKIYLLIVPRRCFFCGSFVMLLCTSVY